MLAVFSSWCDGKPWLGTERLMAEVRFDLRKRRLVRFIPIVCWFILPVLVSLGGCAAPDRQTSTPAPIIAAERYLKESLRKSLPKDKRLGFAVAAARISSNELEEGKGRVRARLIYNASTAELVVLLSTEPHGWNATTVIAGPDANYRVRFASGNKKEAIWDPGLFNKILPASALRQKSLLGVTNPEGFGGVLVGVHKPEDPRKWLLPPMGVSAAVTAVADFKTTASPGVFDVRLALYDPTKRDRAFVVNKERALTADFGAPLAYYPNPQLLEYAALINPMQYAEREGLYLVQPYDSEKIPVVLVHGLMSIPQMWLPIIAQIERDAELRGKFQFWLYAYPTGDPVALLALRLRESLRKVYQVYPKAKSMVMVSYSLGGLLGQMQVQTTGDTVWMNIFKNDAARLRAQVPPDSLLKRALIFEANPRIKRIVFICTPHLGSPLAAGLLGRFGRSIVQMPVRILQKTGHLAAQSLAAVIGQKGHFVPNSIWGMSPKSPLLLSLHPLPSSLSSIRSLEIAASIGSRCRIAATALCRIGAHILTERSPSASSQRSM